MAPRRKPPETTTRRRRPATTPEGRENQLVNLAMKLAEDQIIAGTASSQVITHYLKLGTTREVLEKQKINHENELLKVRVEAMAAATRTEELLTEALSAFRSYSGQDDQGELDD